MRVVVRIDHGRSLVRVTREVLADIRKCVGKCLRSVEIRKRGSAISGLLSPSDIVEVGVSLVSEDDIRALNRDYRGVDSETDVLSFWSDLEADEVGQLRNAGEAVPLGDVVISTERAVEQATQYGHSLRRELMYLVVHGVLHLLGYDHQDEGDRATMRWAEERVLSDLGVTRDS